MSRISLLFCICLLPATIAIFFGGGGGGGGDDCACPCQDSECGGGDRKKRESKGTIEDLTQPALTEAHDLCPRKEWFAVIEKVSYSKKL